MNWQVSAVPAAGGPAVVVSEGHSTSSDAYEAMLVLARRQQYAKKADRQYVSFCVTQPTAPRTAAELDRAFEKQCYCESFCGCFAGWLKTLPDADLCTILADESWTVGAHDRVRQEQERRTSR